MARSLADIISNFHDCMKGSGAPPRDYQIFYACHDDTHGKATGWTRRTRCGATAHDRGMLGCEYNVLLLLLIACAARHLHGSCCPVFPELKIQSIRTCVQTSARK